MDSFSILIMLVPPFCGSHIINCTFFSNLVGGVKERDIWFEFEFYYKYFLSWNLQAWLAYSVVYTSHIICELLYENIAYPIHFKNRTYIIFLIKLKRTWELIMAFQNVLFVMIFLTNVPIIWTVNSQTFQGNYDFAGEICK